MKFFYRKIYLQLFILAIATCAKGQEGWPSPEIAQMYHHAQEYMAMGNLTDAVITYKHAIALAPGNIILYKELGNALYQSGQYKEAEQIVAPLIAKPEADAACYQLLAASQAAQDNRKAALSTLQKGLKRFPTSGMLYHEEGKMYFPEGKPEAALNAWLDGIDKDAGYAPNYYEAAHAYLNSGKVLWGLLYGEILLQMAHDTTGDADMKNKLYAGYKKLFDGLAAGETPQYGKTKPAPVAKRFEDAVLQVYTQLTPVVSDGVSTENLTMVRTRFLMDWFSAYGSKYPFPLFAYQDSLVKYGKFDICNEWLFGKAESAVEYEAWDTFHAGDISRYRAWQAAHELQPAAAVGYNERDMDGLFGKKRR